LIAIAGIFALSGFAHAEEKEKKADRKEAAKEERAEIRKDEKMAKKESKEKVKVPCRF